MSTPPALQGVTVLDLSTVGPATRCARILADYGARLVKVGAPPSRSGVQIEPAWWSYGASRGMSRVRIDLKAPAGRDAFLRMAAAADVVLESYRPGVADRLGIGYADARKANESIVYCSLSGYGQRGPASQWAGHDLDYLAMGGYLDCSGRRADGGPALPGATIADAAAGGMQAAIAILAALLRRAATGTGEHLDVSVTDGVLSLMALAIDRKLATGEESTPGRDLLTGRYACYDTYAARDGRWLAVAAIERAFWANLCRALDLERWIPHQLDDVRQGEIRADLRAVFATRTRDEWVAALAPADTCVAPVLSLGELAGQAHFRARGAFREARHPRHGAFSQLGPVLAGSASAEAIAVPDTAETDTDALLRAVGYAESEIGALRESGVVA
ncbi:MAG TPA: CaiB/BaiF CoA-transferase family protein [Myxococcota bacterium]|nr:CaiB/BaiF CoA-transferase family protein [Myxococcota bacterium]